MEGISMAEKVNSQDISIYKNNLMSLMKIMASLNHASDTLIGKAAKTLMYQTGKDLGRLEGKKLDKSNDLTKTIEMIEEAEKGVWNIEMWKNKESEDHIFEENNAMKAYLVFRECPIRQVCLTHGIPQDQVICRITHGLFAGMAEMIMDKKVDLHVEHAGPNACKKIIEIK
jgi:predicted hydrocarbon binding protein